MATHGGGGEYKDRVVFLAAAGVMVPLFNRLRISPILGFLAAGVLLVREAGGKVCDFRGAALGKIDGRTALPRQIVAGNLKVAEALQKTIVSSGYAASFNG